MVRLLGNFNLGAVHGTSPFPVAVSFKAPL